MAAVYLSMYLSAMGAPGSCRPCGAIPAKGGFLKFASYKTGNIREHHVTASSYPRSGVSAGLGRSGLPSRACRSVWQDLGNLGEGTPALHPEAYRGPAAVRDHRRLAAATVRCLLGYVALPVLSGSVVQLRVCTGNSGRLAPTLTGVVSRRAAVLG